MDPEHNRHEACAHVWSTHPGESRRASMMMMMMRDNGALPHGRASAPAPANFLRRAPTFLVVRVVKDHTWGSSAGNSDPRPLFFVAVIEADAGFPAVP